MTTGSGRVAVLGSLHLDIMVRAPYRPRKGETVVGSEWWTKVGGKGCNQAVAARRHGAPVAMIGCVGADDFADRLIGYLNDADVDTGLVQRTDAAGSGMSVAVVDETGDYGAVIVSGANLNVEESDIARAESAIAASAVLLLQQEVSDAANVLAARSAHALDRPVLLNAAPAKPWPPELAGLVDILVVNAVEAEAMGAGAVGDRESGVTAARHLRSLAPTCVVTLGGQGVAAVDSAGAAHVVKALPTAVHGTHGAGDVFVGALAARLAKDAAFNAALSYANAAASLHVGASEGAQANIGPASVERALQAAD